MSRALVLDDLKTSGLAINSICRKEGFAHVLLSQSIRHAESLANGLQFDLAIVDVNLGERFTGLDFARWLREKQPNCQIVMMSADDHSDGAHAIGARFVQKGDKFEARLRAAIQRNGEDRQSWLPVREPLEPRRFDPDPDREREL